MKKESLFVSQIQLYSGLSVCFYKQVSENNATVCNINNCSKHIKKDKQEHSSINYNKISSFVNPKGTNIFLEAVSETIFSRKTQVSLSIMFTKVKMKKLFISKDKVERVAEKRTEKKRHINNIIKHTINISGEDIFSLSNAVRGLGLLNQKTCLYLEIACNKDLIKTLRGSEETTHKKVRIPLIGFVYIGNIAHYIINSCCVYNQRSGVEIASLQNPLLTNIVQSKNLLQKTSVSSTPGYFFLSTIKFLKERLSISEDISYLSREKYLFVDTCFLIKQLKLKQIIISLYNSSKNHAQFSGVDSLNDFLHYSSPHINNKEGDFIKDANPKQDCLLKVYKLNPETKEYDSLHLTFPAIFSSGTILIICNTVLQGDYLMTFYSTENVNFKYNFFTNKFQEGIYREKCAIDKDNLFSESVEFIDFVIERPDVDKSQTNALLEDSDEHRPVCENINMNKKITTKNKEACGDKIISPIISLLKYLINYNKLIFPDIKDVLFGIFALYKRPEKNDLFDNLLICLILLYDFNYARISEFKKDKSNFELNDKIIQYYNENTCFNICNSCKPHLFSLNEYFCELTFSASSIEVKDVDKRPVCLSVNKTESPIVDTTKNEKAEHEKEIKKKCVEKLSTPKWYKVHFSQLNIPIKELDMEGNFEISLKKQEGLPSLPIFRTNPRSINLNENPDKANAPSNNTKTSNFIDTKSNNTAPKVNKIKTASDIDIFSNDKNQELNNNKSTINENENTEAKNKYIPTHSTLTKYKKLNCQTIKSFSNTIFNSELSSDLLSFIHKLSLKDWMLPATVSLCQVKHSAPPKFYENRLLKIDIGLITLQRKKVTPKNIVYVLINYFFNSEQVTDKEFCFNDVKFLHKLFPEDCELEFLNKDEGFLKLIDEFSKRNSSVSTSAFISSSSKESTVYIDLSKHDTKKSEEKTIDTTEEFIKKAYVLRATVVYLIFMVEFTSFTKNLISCLVKYITCFYFLLHSEDLKKIISIIEGLCLSIVEIQTDNTNKNKRFPFKLTSLQNILEYHGEGNKRVVDFLIEVYKEYVDKDISVNGNNQKLSCYNKYFQVLRSQVQEKFGVNILFSNKQHCILNHSDKKTIIKHEIKLRFSPFIDSKKAVTEPIELHINAFNEYVERFNVVFDSTSVEQILWEIRDSEKFKKFKSLTENKVEDIKKLFIQVLYLQKRVSAYFGVEEIEDIVRAVDYLVCFFCLIET
ncbi:hypothetical protein CDIK_0125 [Cucumispora dikerogammari]|nr:hypothetical protein CDIK_0125 [Cucumispora dikerogammari]